MSNKFILSALGYALLGLALGIYMASSKDHGQFVTHAHIMLVGFVVSFIYGVLYKLWGIDHKFSRAQYLCHQVGTFTMLVSLFCLFGGFVPEKVLGPILGVSSILVFSGMLLMKVMFIKQIKNT